MKKILAGTWILVADGTEARLFHNVGNATTLSLRQDEVLVPENLVDDGPARRTPPESGEQGIDEATFAKQLARRLNADALRNAYEHLVLVADPQTLGQIRPQLHKETEKRIVRYIAKTLTKAPLKDIERALVD